MAIRTGDLVAVRAVHNLLGHWTRVFTRSPYTHVGLAVWIDGELWVAELNGGRNHAIPIAQLDDYDVFDQPPGLINIGGVIREWLRTQVEYGFLSLVCIGLMSWFRIKIFVHWRRILVCSGACVVMWESAGWPEHTRILAPGALAEGLTLQLEVRPVKFAKS